MPVVIGAGGKAIGKGAFRAAPNIGETASSPSPPESERSFGARSGRSRTGSKDDDQVSERPTARSRSSSKDDQSVQSDRNPRSRSRSKNQQSATKESAMTDVSAGRGDREDLIPLQDLPNPASFGPRPGAPPAKQTSEGGLGDTGLGERIAGDVVSPVSPMSPGLRTGRSKSSLMGPMSPKSANSSKSWAAKSNKSGPSWASFDADTGEPPPGMMDLNRPGVIPLGVFSFGWSAAAASILFSMLYIYRFQEVLKQYQLAEETALAHAELKAAEILYPAAAAMEVVQAALAANQLKNLSDYGVLASIMRPVFDSRVGVLEEVELAGGPETSRGSVLVRLDTNRINLISDRVDCDLIPGQRGCSSNPLSASTEQWYKDGFGVDHIWSYVPPETTWTGPVFIRTDQHSAICDQLCWAPTFTFIGRANKFGGSKSTIEGLPEEETQAKDEFGADEAGAAKDAEDPASVTAAAEQDFPSLKIVLVRAVVSSFVFQDVAKTAEKLSKGEALLCTSSGDVIATADMASSMQIDDDTGHLRVGKVWEASNSWASVLTEDMVKDGTKGVYKDSGDYTITVRRLQGPNDDALQLGETLRLVMGTPTLSFMEPTLFSLTWFSCGVSATPPVVMLLAMFVAVYFRRKRTPDATKVGSSRGLTSRLSNSPLGRSVGSLRKQFLRRSTASSQNKNLAARGGKPTVAKSLGFGGMFGRFKRHKSVFIEAEMGGGRVSTAMEVAQQELREGRRVSTGS